MSLQVSKQPKFASQTTIPQPILEMYYDIEHQLLKRKTWQEISEYDIWNELCLCILASNVPFEQAESALEHLKQNNFIEPTWILENSNSVQIIANELSKQICLPRKKDGEFRKYRFPNVRAKNIVDACNFIQYTNSSLKNLLKQFESEEYARNYLAENISGLGLKESSHFLRNIGYATSLAIIDVHIISFLKNLNLISGISSLTDSKYYELENKMQKLANFYGMSLAILDNAIWNYMKFRLK